MQSPNTSPPVPADYHACLLRLWRAGAGGPWRASLQLVEAGERIGFADLERLCAYLLRLTDDAKREPPPTD